MAPNERPRVGATGRDHAADSASRPTVYVETSVVSYLVAKPARDIVIAGRQQVTRDWWDMARRQYRLVVSDAVIREAKAGNPDMARTRLLVLDELDMVRTSPSVERLARQLIDARAIPDRAIADAVHVATAVANGVDYLVSWNFRHIAGAQARKRIDAACVRAGFSPVILCSPDQLMEDSNGTR